MIPQKEGLQEKSFRDCTLQFLDTTFQLKEVPSLPSLEHWLALPYETKDYERQQLVDFRQLLAFNVHDWNEQELDSGFIGPLFSIVNYSSYKFNHFSQRDLFGVVDGYKLFGKPDGLIASGRRLPQKPYFAFAEYKRNLDPDGDPAGQALAAMLVAQSSDEQPKPLYGCYVVGQFWRFMTLEGRKYTFSQDYSATTDDIFIIFRILKALKQIVIEYTGGVE